MALGWFARAAIITIYKFLYRIRTQRAIQTPSADGTMELGTARHAKAQPFLLPTRALY